MSIISALPFNLQNGTTADATQVMANFNQVVSNVNANAATAGANSNITSITGLTTPLSPTQGGTGVASPTSNTVPIAQAGGAMHFVGPGTAGQALLSNGTGSDPTFQTIGIVPAGAGMFWPTATPPTGWVEAKGQSTSGMSAAIISIYGATLPDMRGQFPRGWDDGAGVDPGRTLLSTQTDAIASHSVSVAITDPTHAHTVPSDAGFAGTSATLAGSNLGGDTSNVTSTAVATGITAAGTYTGASETRPKNVAWMFIIKT